MKILSDLLQKKASRACVSTAWCSVWKASPSSSTRSSNTIDVVVDRVVLKTSATSRIAESVETATKAFRRSRGATWSMKRPKKSTGRNRLRASRRYGRATISIRLPLHVPSMAIRWMSCSRATSVLMPLWRLPRLRGPRQPQEVDSSLLIPDPSLSLNEGCIAPFATGNITPGASRGMQTYGRRPGNPVGRFEEENARRAVVRP